MSDTSTRKDFFVSYSSADQLWAEWIAWQLEQANYSVMLQPRNFQVGQNVVQSMQDIINETERTLVVLSPDYLDDLEAHAEWVQMFRTDPTGEKGRLLPVQVRECKDRLKGVLSLLSYVDLIGRDEEEASAILLTGVQLICSKPLVALSDHVINEQPSFPINFPRIWNVPQRNRFFTAREEIIQHLHHTFTNKNMRVQTLSQAISGLGGMGKTQIAIEYAYRYRHEYQAVLWLAAESQSELVQSCQALVRELGLPQKDAKNHEEIIEAVHDWLQDHVDWLLILDNADDPHIARDFLPSAANGHVLMTTRAQAVGRVAKAITIDKMTPEEGASFLLQRADLPLPDEPSRADDPQWRDAICIAEVMDGLPLALDQAGGYIEEVGCSLAEYLSLYEKHGTALLRRRGEPIFDHPKSVATTWSLSFEQVQQNNAIGADILRLCAFLAADDIPEELLSAGIADISDPLAINEAVATLRRYSLIRRNPQNRTLSVHRLVQAVLRDMLSTEVQQQWAEQAVHAVNKVFPEVKFETWVQCQRYLSHARVCADAIEHWQMHFPEAAYLLRSIGLYLQDHAQYADAERLLQRALTIYEQLLDNPSIIRALNNLANLDVDMGKYAEAEQHYLKSVSIIEDTLGLEHPDLINTLDKLLTVYSIQGRYSDAKAIAERALALSEKFLEPDHPIIVISLNNLAKFYMELGEYRLAEPLVQRALDICERTLSSKHPLTGACLNNLASLYQDQGKYEEAEPLYQRALVIAEQVQGSMHPNTATSLNNLALLYQDQGKYEEAEPLYQRALVIAEQVQGSMHPDTATSLNNLASLYKAQDKYEEAEPLYQRALVIAEQVQGSMHPDTAISLNNLASLYLDQRQLEKVEPLIQQALSIREQMLGPDHPSTANSLRTLARLSISRNNLAEAELLYRRALSIHEKALSIEHPNTIRTQQALDNLLRKMRDENDKDLEEENL